MRGIFALEQAENAGVLFPANDNYEISSYHLESRAVRVRQWKKKVIPNEEAVK
jgi:hypothetical protein